MPLIADRNTIRATLSADPAWCVYGLGDLDPRLFPYTTWLQPEGEPAAIALLFRGGGAPVLFTAGAPAGIAKILGEIAGEPELSLHVRPEILPVIASRYEILKTRAMWRMALDPSRYRPPAPPEPPIVRLNSRDSPALERLYDDGRPAGEAPDYFLPWMLDQFLYLGVREGEELAVVAGTHLISREEGVAAIGNVYTRRDRRGRGFATALTGAIAGRLAALGIPVVALSVAQANAPAIRIYERLGFLKHCEFVEGQARLREIPGTTVRSQRIVT